MPPIPDRTVSRSDSASIFDNIGITSYFLVEAGLRFLSPSTVQHPLSSPSLGPTSVVAPAAPNPSLGLAAAEIPIATKIQARFISVTTVESTISRIWTDGAAKVRVAGPAEALWRDPIGFKSRNLAFAEQSVLRSSGSLLSRSMVAGFFLELGFISFHRLQKGSARVDFENQIYALADARQSADRHFAWSLLKGAADLIAPTVSARVFVGSKYLEEARSQWQKALLEDADEVKHYLLYSLLIGPSPKTASPTFNQKFDWRPLRGEDVAKYYEAKGGKLEIEFLAEVLSDPRIHRRMVESQSPQAQAKYIREQFRGYRLDEQDVKKILSEVSFHQIRKRIVGLKMTDPSGDLSWLRLFDEAGRLIPGQEVALLKELLDAFDSKADGAVLETQVLELRKTVLANRLPETATPLRAKLNPADIITGILRYKHP